MPVTRGIPDCPDFAFEPFAIAARPGPCTFADVDRAIAELKKLESYSHRGSVPERFDCVRRGDVLSAGVRVLSRYQAAGVKPPPLHFPEGGSFCMALHSESQVKSREFANRLSGRELPSERTDKLVGVRHLTDGVMIGRIGGERKIFREIRLGLEKYAYVARKTMAAASLNRDVMGLDTVPAARLALVNGMLGAVSDFAHGVPLDYHNAWQFGAVRLGGWSEAVAFEFLSGNMDVQFFNARLDGEGRFRVFDHDGALYPGLPLIQSLGACGPFGTLLPRRYTARFIAGLSRLDNGSLIAGFETFLSPHELQGVALRRDLIAADIKSRWPHCLMPENEEGARSWGPALWHGAIVFAGRLAEEW